MKLGFAEEQAPYQSGSQKARFWTEPWVGKHLYCPSCGHRQIERFPANRPAADFFCSSCAEEFELKSQKTAFGRKVLDGAYRTMLERVSASNNPNLLLLRYDLANRSVTDVAVVPKQFLVPEVLEERRPLPPTARRAGWVGCNILLSEIPAAGRIYLVRNQVEAPKESVIAQWKQTLFLRSESSDARGWLIETMKCVDAIGRPEFDLEDVYAFEARLSTLYPGNRHVRPKIRQQLQVLRDSGYLEFLGRGHYRLRGPEASR
ncbi:MAG: DpnI domain-containing protein [Bauldia sp.]